MLIEHGGFSLTTLIMDVLLLKTADAKYAAAFQQHAQSMAIGSVSTHFSEVLAFEYLNVEELALVLLQLQSTYSGIIVTSPRASTAIVQVLEAQTDDRTRQTMLANLRAVHVFSVGAATSRDLAELGISCRGEDAGSADKLAELLAQDGVLPTDCASKRKPMVFLCGEKHRDALPASFHDRNLPLCELTVYKSRTTDKLVLPDSLGHRMPRWVAFFSPSGIAAARNLDIPWEDVRKAAIGKTTAAALTAWAEECNQAHWNADVVAPKPTAEALAESILDFERASR
ncbi:TPA: hypothetical protein N0F65_001244 [Lagenidium giganteum]|uniref:Uroporphyrinogen-III synthase n=1 Tax=Lagenidium giganteum TaxID=4803 RepID=A0AAV2YSU3_9STRA|nr:TPA: hypothetical protein N0F65_001244 [Lagenidium giganteum]